MKVIYCHVLSSELIQGLCTLGCGHEKGWIKNKNIAGTLKWMLQTATPWSQGNSAEFPLLGICPGIITTLWKTLKNPQTFFSREWRCLEIKRPDQGGMFPIPSREGRGVSEGFTKLAGREEGEEGWDNPWQAAREERRGISRQWLTAHRADLPWTDHCNPEQRDRPQKMGDDPSKNSMETRESSSLSSGCFSWWAEVCPSTAWAAQASCNALYCFIFTTRAPQRNNWASTLCHIKELKGKWVERLDCAPEIPQFNWNSRNTPRFEEGLSWLDYSTSQFSPAHQDRKFLFTSTFSVKFCFLPSFIFLLQTQEEKRMKGESWLSEQQQG